MAIKLTESQTAVLQKYLSETHQETTWEQVVERVCRFVANAEATDELKEFWYQQFKSIIEPMYFIPGGSILGNSNHGTNGLLNCFVLSAEDDIYSIADTVKNTILTTKFRGGVGINIASQPGETGYIRHEGAPYKDGVAFGPIAMLDMISSNSSYLTIGNRARRGAFLFSMHWKHPDIFKFIVAKSQSMIDADILKRAVNGTLTQAEFDEAWVETHLSPTGKRQRKWYNANISVQLDDEFFKILDSCENKPFDRLTDIELTVHKLWELIPVLAHQTADPGIIFISTMKNRSPIGEFITTTNPCGEVPLPPNSACNLGSIDLSKFLVNGFVNFALLEKVVKIAVRFLDNVLTVSSFATEAQKHNVQNVYRQLGLGIMGWADLLKQLLIPYCSEENLNLIDRIGDFIADTAYRTSEELAVEKGACGIWDQIKDRATGNLYEHWHNDYCVYYGDEVCQEDGKVYDIDHLREVHQKPRRNSTILSIAPTGSIAQLAGCSWAFEPDFGLVIYKQVFVDAAKKQQQWVPIVTPYLEKFNLSESDKEIVINSGSLKGTQFAKKRPGIAEVFTTANEVPYEWHIKVQSQWQKYLDSSASKTINMPKEATVEDIKNAYRLAHQHGLKGITVYRSGTLESEPIKVGADNHTDKADDNFDNTENSYVTCKSGTCDL